MKSFYRIILCFIFIFAYQINVIGSKSRKHTIDRDVYEDTRLSVPELLIKYGYTPEIHHVVTKDGYIIELHRIVKSPKYTESEFPKKRKIILELHGMFSTSAELLFRSSTNSLAHLIADRGYDLWLSNARGNRYSRNHTTISPDSKDFWKFSLHEIGIYDIPACIDYILKVTNQRKLTFVGYSQGATIFLIFAAERPEYMKKISHVHLFAPGAFYHQSFLRHGLLRILLPLVRMFLYEPNEFQINSKWLYRVIEDLCNIEAYTSKFCKILMFELVGYDPKQLDNRRFTFYGGHYPSSTSTWLLLHFAQFFMDEKFNQLDLGEKQNLIRYGTEAPPDYDLRTIEIPMMMYIGGNDKFYHPNDFKNLTTQLSTIIGVYEVPWKHFNHLDFILAKDLDKLLYGKFFEILDKYS